MRTRSDGCRRLARPRARARRVLGRRGCVRGSRSEGEARSGRARIHGPGLYCSAGGGLATICVRGGAEGRARSLDCWIVQAIDALSARSTVIWLSSWAAARACACPLSALERVVGPPPQPSPCSLPRGRMLPPPAMQPAPRPSFALSDLTLSTPSSAPVPLPAPSSSSSSAPSSAPTPPPPAGRTTRPSRWSSLEFRLYALAVLAGVGSLAWLGVGLGPGASVSSLFLAGAVGSACQLARAATVLPCPSAAARPRQAGRRACGLAGQLRLAVPKEGSQG